MPAVTSYLAVTLGASGIVRQCLATKQPSFHVRREKSAACSNLSLGPCQGPLHLKVGETRQWELEGLALRC